MFDKLNYYKSIHITKFHSATTNWIRARTPQIRKLKRFVQTKKNFSNSNYQLKGRCSLAKFQIYIIHRFICIGTPLWPGLNWCRAISRAVINVPLLFFPIFLVARCTRFIRRHSSCKGCVYKYTLNFVHGPPVVSEEDENR